MNPLLSAALGHFTQQHPGLGHFTQHGLGEVPGGTTDVLYTGDTGSSAFSLQYWRDKANEFQVVMNALDSGMRAAQDMLGLPIDADTANALLDSLAEFDAKRATIKSTAEAINLGAQAINAMGGRFPVLSVPMTLGAVPLLLPAAAIVALGIAAALVVWGKTWLDGLNQRMQQAVLLDAVEDPDKKAALAAAMAASQAAVNEANSAGFSSIAKAITWGCAGLIAYGLFRWYKAAR